MPLALLLVAVAAVPWQVGRRRHTSRSLLQQEGFGFANKEENRDGGRLTRSAFASVLYHSKGNEKCVAWSVQRLEWATAQN